MVSGDHELAKVDGGHYSLEEIKSAFWDMFHRGGTRHFRPHGPEKECEADTRLAWDEFIDGLPRARD